MRVLEMDGFLRSCSQKNSSAPGCGAWVPFTFHGKTNQTCNGKIEFKMEISEF